jgi:signal transduction histidine kinase
LAFINRGDINTMKNSVDDTRNFKLFLSLGFGMLIVLLVFCGLSIVLMASDLQLDIELIQSNYTQSVRLIGEAGTEANYVRVLVRDLVVENDPATRINMREQIDSAIVEISHRLAATRHIVVQPEEEKDFQRYITAFDQYVDAVREVINLALSGKKNEAVHLLGTKMIPYRSRFEAISEDLVETNLQAARVTQEHIDSLKRKFVLTGVAILVLALLTSILIYRFVSRTFGVYHASIKSVRREQENLLFLLQERQKKIEHLVISMTTIEEDQRKRFAQELHDAIGHGLTIAKYHTDSARAELVGASPVVLAHLDKALATIQETLKETKRISYEMRPTLLDDLGLIAAMKQLFTEFERRSGIKVHSEFGELAERLPAITEITVYRIVQEAFTNAEKHSEAKNAHFQMLVRDDGTLIVSISDDGKGFNVGKVAMEQDSHFGLRNILERGELIGGTVLIESRPGKGCEINVELPLKLRKGPS